MGDVGAAARQTSEVGASTSQEVRRVLSAGDGAAALTVARSLGLNGPLQHVGDLVLLALDHDSPDAAEFAAECSDALRVRGCDGDQELADAIDAAAGRVLEEVKPLTELTLDLDQLADLLDGGPDSAGGRLDLTTGEVLPEFAFEDTFDEEDVEDDAPDRWLHVWPTGSRRAYNDMVDFIATRTASSCVNNWISRWMVGVRSAGSRTSCSTGQMTVRTGLCSQTTVAADGLASGSPRSAIAPRFETAPSNPVEPIAGSDRWTRALTAA